MTLEADQAVQEARFAGACQDQRAGRPAPSLGPGERKSIVQQAETSVVSLSRLRAGARVPRGLGPRARRVGPGGKRARDTTPTPPPGPPRPSRFQGKGEFTLSVTETIQHAPQGQRTVLLKRGYTSFHVSLGEIRALIEPRHDSLEAGDAKTALERTGPQKLPK